MMTRLSHVLLDRDFIKSKIEQACAYRNTGNLKQLKVKRLVHSESDELSGLKIDQWGDRLSVQCLTRALETRYEWIIDALQSLGWSRDQIIKDDRSGLRKFEGLPLRQIAGFPELEYREAGVTYRLSNPAQFTIDRRNIRSWMIPYAADKVVWDLFCGNGNLGYACAVMGAKSVTLVDNEPELSFAPGLAAHDHINVLHQNAFSFLKQPVEQAPDLVILDMPVFHVTGNELKPYRELGLQVLKKLKKGGLLVFGTGSSKIRFSQIYELIMDWNIRLKANLQVIHSCTGPDDFPVHPLYPHTDYLRFVCIRNC